MKFIKDRDIYKVVRITGPSHNFLGLVVSSNDDENYLEIIDIDKKEKQVNGLSSSRIKQEVLSGLSHINHELKKNYRVKKIYYIGSDTPNPEIYSSLTKEIITRISSGFEFEKA